MNFTARFARAFPAPRYLAMAGAGIDISSSSLKCVSLESAPWGARLASYRTRALEEGVIVGGDIEKPEKLVEVLRTLRIRERVLYAHASLPERKSYLYQTSVPSAAADLYAAAEFSLEGNVPLPPGEISFDVEMVRRTTSGSVVAVTAYAKRIVEAYRDVFTRAGITLLSLEVESHAAARAVLSPALRAKTLMLVDFGAAATRIAVLDGGAVSFTATIDVGGAAMTAAIVKHFSVSSEEAEKIKNEQGFLEGGKNRKLFEALMLTVSVLRDELMRHIAFWNTPGEHDVPRRELEGIVVIGGNANLKGLPEFLGRSLKLPVLVGNVWQNAYSLDHAVPPMPFNESLQYGTAIGLALRSHSGVW